MISEAVVLGLVQGLSEFLPISSSAHLILAPWFMEWTDPGLAFDVALHLGTLLAVVAYFHRDLFNLAAGPERLRWTLMMIAATLPGGFAGWALHGAAETHLRSPLLIAGTLAGGALILLWADRRGGERALEGVTLRDAVIIGCAQALAIVPGVSRSGATIVAGLCLGFTRIAAARFSFLLSIPIIAAAGLLEVPRLFEAGFDRSTLAAGFAASALAGFLAIALLLRVVRTRSYLPFALYRIGLAGLILFAALR